MPRKPNAQNRRESRARRRERRARRREMRAWRELLLLNDRAYEMFLHAARSMSKLMSHAEIYKKFTGFYYIVVNDLTLSMSANVDLLEGFISHCENLLIWADDCIDKIRDMERDMGLDM